MRRRPAFAAIVIAAAGLGTVLAAPSSAHIVAAEPLAAVTTVTATHSGSAEVVLYDDVTLSPRTTGNPDVSISGNGRLVGIQLTRSDGASDGFAAFREPAFAGGQVITGGSTTPAPTCTQGLVSNSCTSPTPKAILLHEGYYHLVVLTDGAPLRITLRLRGTSHAPARVHLQRAFRSVEAALPERESMGASTVTFGGEQAAGGASQVAALIAARLHSSAAFRAITVCSRTDNGAPPPYAFSAACPGGTDQGYAWRLGGPLATVGGGMGGVGGVFLVGLPEGGSQKGIGGSLVDSDGPDYLGGLGLWVWGETLAVDTLPLSTLS